MKIGWEDSSRLKTGHYFTMVTSFTNVISISQNFLLRFGTMIARVINVKGVLRNCNTVEVWISKTKDWVFFNNYNSMAKSSLKITFSSKKIPLLAYFIVFSCLLNFFVPERCKALP